MPEPVIVAIISPEKSDMAVCIFFLPGNRLKIDHISFLRFSARKQLLNGVVMIGFHGIVCHPMKPVARIDLAATKTSFVDPGQIRSTFFQNISDKPGTVHCPISTVGSVRTHAVLCCQRISAVRRSQIITVLFVVF